MKMTFEELKTMTTKQNHTKMGILQWVIFITWVLSSQIVLLFPLILLGFTFLILN